MQPVPAGSYEPPRPVLIAVAVFALTTLSLCWPMLGGQLLLGDDQYVAGYAFRLFGAEYFRSHGAIPEWNPYLFGGVPYIAAQHGDIFYPTAWLRWFLPVDTAMNLGFALHLFLAGCTMYAFLRALRLGWAGALLGGIAYQLTGIVASLVKPGHDGKLFVSALAPLALLALLRAIRDRRLWGYGLLALTVGLCLLSPHYQMTYYLLVAGGLWALYLALWDPERPAGVRWYVPVGAALGAVLLGLAIAAIQVLPFLAYIPFSPRAAGGPSGGWEYAVSYSMPPEELLVGILPQFMGVLEQYWGRNFFKLHTEYLGAAVVFLAALGWGDRKRRPLLWATGAIAFLFLLISLGGHTPFYRLWYEVMPMMKKVRAPGMAFYLVALVVAVWAGIGADRLVRREVTRTAILIAAGVLGGIALLGAIGGLQAFATLLAAPEQADRVAANAPTLQVGAFRLLLVVLATGAVALATWSGRLRGAGAVALLALVTAADLWSIDRLFFQYHPPAARVYRQDDIVAQMKEARPPFRVLDVGVYPGSYLMTHDLQAVLGYHGNEVRFYDELLGGKNVWANLNSPAVLDLVATRFIILPDTQSLPGFHQVLGPVPTTPGRPGVLFERDSATRYLRLFSAAVKVPDEQAVPALVDPRFPYERVVVLSDTASVTPDPIQPGQLPEPLALRATLKDWSPGRMQVAFEGAEKRPAYLLISETWYPDWHATIDGQDAPVHRVNHAFLGIVIPPGARELELWFASSDYRLGRLITMLALLTTAGLLATPWLRRRHAVMTAPEAK